MSRIVSDVHIVGIARGVVEILRAPHVAEVQLIEDASGSPRVIEVNARFSATVGLSVAAGINMPALVVAEALGTPIPERLVSPSPVGVVRYAAEVVIDAADLESGAMRDRRGVVSRGARGG